MNIFKLLLISLLITSVNSFAQYSYGRTGGVIRNIGGQNATNSTTNREPSPEEIAKYKTERMDKYMEQLKKDLNLDDLQYIVIKNDLTSNMREMDIIMKKETSQEDKGTEVKALMEKTEQIINSYLNKDQKEKYKALIEQNRLGKKDKKDKKNKKGDKQEEAKPEEVKPEE